MKAIVYILLIIQSMTAFAQQKSTEDQIKETAENKKKPSWSTGLPERQTAPSLGKPAVEMDQPEVEIAAPEAIEMPTAELAIDRPQFEMPAIELETTTSAVVPPPAQSSSRARKASQKDLAVPTSNNAPENPAAVVYMADYAGDHDYSWEIYTSEPIKIPKSLSFSYKSVDLEVHLNPEGKVVKVKRVSDLTSNLILNYSSKTLKKWQFRPPAEFGVSETLVRNMNVNLVAR